MTGGSLTILHEDAALLIVEKPAGLHTAPLEAHETDTLLALVLASFPEVSSVPGMKRSEHGLLHRLDRDTSGVVVIARTSEAFIALRRQFEAEEVKKEYHAVCACGVEKRVGESVSVRSSFAPSGPGRRKVRVVMPDEHKRQRGAARGVYCTEACLERLQGGRALVSAVIQRGFRHQIRAHLAFTGLPIFGDALYGVPAPPEAEQRMYLHASAISLTHPVTGKLLRILSPLPDSFHAILG